MGAAFASTMIGRVPAGGGKYRSWGHYASTGGGTGGDINTGNARYTDILKLQPHGAAVSVSAPVINETYNDCGLPVACTIITVADETGRWESIGV